MRLEMKQLALITLWLLCCCNCHGFAAAHYPRTPSFVTKSVRTPPRPKSTTTTTTNKVETTTTLTSFRSLQQGSNRNSSTILQESISAPSSTSSTSSSPSNTSTNTNNNNDDIGDKNSLSKNNNKKRFFELSGQATHEIEIPNNDSATSIQNWLQNEDCIPFLLGGDPKSVSYNGNVWECQQPRIAFLGLDLTPIFLQKVKQSPTETQVSIVGAKTKINASSSSSSSSSPSTTNDIDASTSSPSKANKVIQNLMQQAQFKGGSIIRTKSSKLSVDLSLSLMIPRPRFVWFPPGFQSIGNRIIQQTCRRRTIEFVKVLQKAHEEWMERT